MNGRLRILEATFRAELRALRPREQGAPLCERHVVVLLHGWGGWTRQLLSLEQRLERRLGRRIVRARFGRGLDCIRDCAERAYRGIQRITRERVLESVDLVGHSMGGLVATELLKSRDRGRLVRSVVTLGTPHRGSPLAHVGSRVLGSWSGSLEQMLPESPFVRELLARPLPAGSALHSVAGTRDLLVPPRYAELPRRPGHHNVVLLGADHWGLVLDSSALDLVAALLRGRAPGAQPVAGRCAGCALPGEDVRGADA